MFDPLRHFVKAVLGTFPRGNQMENQVTCITKPDYHSPVEHITHLGGPAQGGGNWYITREDMIQKINSRQYVFYVLVGGAKAYVEVAERNGVAYVKTKPDATQRDNLLSLPQCR